MALEQVTAGLGEGGLQGLEYLPRHVDRVLDPAHSGQQQRELVPPEAGDGVVVAQAFAKPLRHVLEQAVAAGVAERVVDHLEAVDVHEQQGQPLAVAARVVDRHLEAVPEEEPVRQAGQGVVEGQVPDLLLRLPAVRDVADDGGDEGLPAGLPVGQ
jgi:hypothetical protein